MLRRYRRTAGPTRIRLVCHETGHRRTTGVSFRPAHRCRAQRAYNRYTLIYGISVESRSHKDDILLFLIES